VDKELKAKIEFAANSFGQKTKLPKIETQMMLALLGGKLNNMRMRSTLSVPENLLILS
jgi:hypothetical protein